MRITARALDRAMLGRQMLLGRESLDVGDAVRRVVALQAQRPAPPYLALWNRLTDRFTASGLTVDDADALVPELLDFADRPRTTAECEAWLAERLGAPMEPGAWWGLRQYAPLLHAPTGGPGRSAPGPRTSRQARGRCWPIRKFPPRLMAMGQDPAGLRRLEPRHSARLPQARDPHEPPGYRKHVTRMNGDVLPTQLVDGYVAGVWRPAAGQLGGWTAGRLGSGGVGGLVMPGLVAPGLAVMGAVRLADPPQ